MPEDRAKSEDRVKLAIPGSLDARGLRHSGSQPRFAPAIFEPLSDEQVLKSVTEGPRSDQVKAGIPV
jgi:hypothetical protein